MTDTILHRLHENGRIRPNAPAYYEKIGNAWVPTSWKEYTNQVRQAARALVALGVDVGQNVTILGFNRPEWVIFDLACMMIGGAPAGIYTTNSPSECKYIVENSESSVILVENESQWDKIQQVREDLACLKHIVLMKGTEIDDNMTLSWDGFMAKGDSVDEAEVDARMNALQDDQLATLIYTSGTTGPPKGVMLSHRNLASTAKNAQGLIDLVSSDRTISYLPLSHIAEQMFTIHAAITAAYQVYYAEYSPQEHLNKNLKEVKPTVFFGVPRIFERFQAGVAAQLSQATGVKAKIAAWARSVGTKATTLHNRGQSPGGLLALQYKLAEKLVFSTVKEGLGLSEARVLIVSAAPISPDILHYFASLDMPILELYGQSEDCGPTTTNRLGAIKIGTVGQAWPGSEVKLAPDGEILVKGPNVFLGYFKNEAATENDLIDGWLHSGDLGQFDEEGYLSIVGRKKEIIITSGGKNIAPKNIEAALKNLDLVSQAVVIGEQRRFLTALITLDPEAATHFAQQNSLEGKTLHEHPTLIGHLQKEIDEKVNALFARVEHVRAFRVLPRDFTVEDGELTPTLKIKRRNINKNFSNQIESMYED
ncbi:MAG: long-chain fatty acid--CoA ligase [Ardenticatenaceae bacterium]|nr:long-chain fatty acid--CoA ligase [Anaerolineales bacterium]MCB9009345.1 long-chain fatty acid--CoA ligase [Ardenticatenaceae bacterium]